jgi:ribosome-associated protein
VIPDLPRPELGWAIEAAQNKKGAGITLLDLRKLGSFTDYFLICSGFSAPQIQAIADGIEQELGSRGIAPAHREGYQSAEWVLLDYGGFLVHIFSEKARLFYDLERLWRSARRMDIPEPGAAPATGTAPR